MNNLAIVFPGQGSQSSNMLADFYDNFAVFRNALEESSDALGYDLWQVIAKGNEQLNKTEFTQPAIVAASVGLWNVLRKEREIAPRFLAGHSVGEYSALVAASVINLADAVKLVSARGKLMQEAVPEGKGAMAAIIGATDEAVAKVCNEASTEGCAVSPANFNSPGQVVISGNAEAVAKAEPIAKENGARKFVMLDVSVPSHCVLMKDAAIKLQELLLSVEFNKPEIPVIHNFDVQPHGDKNSIVDALVKQLYGPVQWTKTVELFAKENIEQIIECGPGKVLTGLNKRIAKEINSEAVLNVDFFK